MYFISSLEKTVSRVALGYALSTSGRSKGAARAFSCAIKEADTLQDKTSLD